VKHLNDWKKHDNGRSEQLSDLSAQVANCRQGRRGGLLTVPAVAMQFTRKVYWSGSDFAVMGVMLLLAGPAFEGLVRASPS